MTRIVIEGLVDRASLLSALSVVLTAFNSEEAYQREEHRFLPSDDGPDSPPDRAPVSDSPEPRRQRRDLRPLVPCPSRGTHQRLTECWLCWSDVMRGAALEPEVLSMQAWHSDHSD